MLGKTANGLYWMYRYLERAENTARLIETGQRIGLTRLDQDDDEWASVMQSASMFHGYKETHDEVTKDGAIDWMLRSKDNPSSVLSSISAARQNARLVRTALTNEVWEALNGCYMKAQEILKRKVTERDLPAVLEVIRQRTALVRGMTHGTMLRNDIYDFARLGTFLERADNTARILDVKYYVLLPSAFSVGSSLDNVHWETILRSLSARGGFRMAYGSQVNARDIAQFLILDKRMPRSLNFCATKIYANLRYLASDYKTEPESSVLAQRLVESFMHNDIEVVFEAGLHEYIQSVLNALGELGAQIEKDYRFYE
ncbi:alpha-E domain-containing protein [Celeribacter litoreus]|uniref:alpha-E domain-containing protein n=1 Tax=Celeribacter litoreus TaxID=2876714 RepID=UPI001CCEE614|nr:alpha-E domain-containing protein [Celeribacter litoreus]MCA0042914.1 alpha-E domain-containing protein [Celeribacter litoreus]